MMPLCKKEWRKARKLALMMEKLLKGILKHGIYLHLERHGWISGSQSGFVPGKSCPIKLIDVFDEMMERIDDVRLVNVHVDFSKAVNKVSHSGLSKRLEHMVSGVS